MTSLGIDWSVYIIITSSLLLLSSLVFYTEVEEGEMVSFSFEERKENVKKIVSSGKAVCIATGFSLG